MAIPMAAHGKASRRFAPIQTGDHHGRDNHGSRSHPDHRARKGKEEAQVLLPLGIHDSVHRDHHCRHLHVVRAAAEGTSGKEVHYDVLFQKRLGLLRKAYANSSIEADVSYQAFVQKNSEWLADYALFMAIKDNKSGKSYLEWEDAIRLRSPEAMVSYRNRLLEDVNFYQFVQYEFYTQWAALKKYANDKGISIIGDIPIYVALDSADTWAHPELFQFDENGLPTAVAGCPPDAFSATGQLWPKSPTLLCVKLPVSA